MSAEKIDHVVAGAIYGFAAFLTGRQERLVASASDNAAPMAEAVQAFLEKNGVDGSAPLFDWTNRLSFESERVKRAYSERNALAVLAAKLAIIAGLPAGKGIDDNKDWEPQWRQVVYIDLPNGAGQVSWHIAPSELHLLDDVPPYAGKWDGTFLSRSTDYVRAVVASSEAPVAIQQLADDPTNAKFPQTMWAEMSPDVYSGESCDQVRPSWHAHAEGDMDSDYTETVTLDSKQFPPGTKILVIEPCCPKCGPDTRPMPARRRMRLRLGRVGTG